MTSSVIMMEIEYLTRVLMPCDKLDYVKLM